MMRTLAAVALMTTLAATALAEGMGDHVTQELTPADIVFQDNPAFPKGAQTAVIVGDPSKPGLFVLRAKFPPNYVVPPHTHPAFETVTILKGTMGSGMGDKVDKSKGKVLPTGSILALPANHAHYVWSGDEELIVQVAANGPFDLIYVNPADDPRKK
jgi:quercetin dioxygenase-like cupin family protein